MQENTNNKATIEAILEEHSDRPGALLPILQDTQKAVGYIPEDCVAQIAAALNLSRAEVHGVISFYHFFRSSPPGKHVVQICRAESCQAMGSRQLEAHARETLKIDFNQTSADGQVTLQPVYCLGNCACSPSVRVGDSIYSHMNPEKFDALVDELLTEPLQITD